MANFERYEPRIENAGIFDGGAGEEHDEDEGSRLPLLLVMGLMAAVAFTGFVYLAYMQGVQRGRADAPKMVVVDSPATNAASAGPGSVETPFKGLKIFQQPAPADEEDPDSAPQHVAPKLADKPVKTQVSAVAPAPKTASPAKIQATAAARPVLAAAATEVPSEAPAATHAPRTLVAQPKIQPAPVPPVEAAPAASLDTTPSPAAASAGGVALQIGAYKSDAEANAAFSAFIRKHPIANGHASEIRKADLAEKGIWYRLRLGGFADKAEAASFCDKLKADGASCIVAK